MSNTVEFKIKISDISGSSVKNIIASLSDVDDLMGQITSEAKKSSRAFDEAASAAFKFNQVSEALGSVADMLSNAVAPAREFETAMRAVNTMAGLGEKDFEKLTDAVAGISKEVPIARDLLGNGLYQVISNGVPQDNWLTFLEMSARSSVGGIADLGRIVTVTSTVIKNYALEWEAAGAIQDKMQMTAKRGVTTFEQLAEALPRVSGSAATLGISVDELLASFATLTGVSGNTSEVSTQLAAVMTSLIRPTSEATELAKAMGIEFNAASVKAAGGLNNFLTSLNSTVNGYAQSTGMLREEILGTLFSSAEALRAVIPLTGELGSSFVENTAAVASSAGTMDAAFEQMNSTADNFERRLSNWVAGFSDLALSIIGNVTPFITLAAHAGQLIAQMGGLSKILTAVGVKQVALKVATLAQAAAAGVVAIASKAYAVAIGALTVAFGSGRAAAIAFWSAATLGVGLLIYGVIEAISTFTGTTDENTKALNENSEALDKAKQAKEDYNGALQGARSEMSVLIAEIKNFNGTKTEEANKVSELNQKYGDTFGTFNTLSKWYDTLTQKSGIYARYIASESKIRALGNVVAEKSVSLQGVDRKDYETEVAANPNAPESSIKAWVDEWNSHFTELDAANLALEDAVKEHAKLGEQLLGGAVKSTLTPGGEPALPLDPKTLAELNLSIEAYEKKLTALSAADVDQAASINKRLDALREERTLLQQILGITSKRESVKLSGVGQSISSVVDVDTSEIEDFNYNQELVLSVQTRLEGLETAQNEIARLTELLAFAQTPGQSEAINKQIVAWNNYAESIGGVGQKAGVAMSVMGNISSIFSGMSNVVDGAAGAWLNYASGVISAVSQMIPALLAVTMGESFAGAAAVPFPFNLAALTASGVAVAAAFASIPKFADGGIVYGPTVGLMGEYSGASNNPEVIAPLNKLRGLLTSPGEGGLSGDVRFEIGVDALIGILRKGERKIARTNG